MPGDATGPPTLTQPTSSLVISRGHMKLAVDDHEPPVPRDDKGPNPKAGTFAQFTRDPSRAELIQLEAERIPSIKTSTWNPFTLFPKEVWELIFNNLANPMENVINSTPEWRQMYLPQRTILLFQQVVTILAETADQSKKLVEDNEYGYCLEQGEYFNCRLVNRSWDQSVQNYIQDHPFHYKLDHLEDEVRMTGCRIMEKWEYLYWQNNSFEWYGQEWVAHFIEEMEPTHPPTRNPFLTRRVTLHDIDMELNYGESDHDAAQLLWSTVGNLLEKYGRHLWHFTLNYKWNLTQVTWYNKIHHWISLTPNLKVLDLKYRSGSSENEGWTLAQLENQIASIHMSSLEHLIMLKTKDVPGPVFNEIICNSPNLQKLQIQLSGKQTGIRLCHYDLDILSNHHLTEACLTLVASEDFWHIEATLPSWPLKTLYIDLGYEGEDWKTDSYPTWPDWNGIFGMLGNKFGSTLTELKLRLPKASRYWDKKQILSDNLQYRLNLPNLNELRVIVPNLSSFDFLLPLKSSLKELVLVVDHHEYEDGRRKRYVNEVTTNEILKFTGNFANLFETNVFKEFRKLKGIQLYVSHKRKLASHFHEYEYDIHEYRKELNQYRLRKF